MSSKVAFFLGCAVMAATPWTPLYADGEAPKGAEAPPAADAIDEEMQREIDYAVALIDGGFPDLAPIVIEATKKRWPESDAQFFAIEVRGLLTCNKFDEAEKKIASLPDRKGSKYWAARLELANSYAQRNRKKECADIYDAFFKAFEKPPKELIKFYMNACYGWGQLLVRDKRFDEATVVYERLLTQPLKIEDWCTMACETCEIYIRLATETKDQKKRPQYLDAADKLTKKLLDHHDQAICFGRAVAMKAHVELLRGKVERAQEFIDEYMPDLITLHEGIVNYDPDGKKGLRKMSPLPQCRYLMAEMLWKEAQKTYANRAKLVKDSKGKLKEADVDEQVKAYLFGAKDKTTSKRNGQGCYNHAINVFLKYPESTWAAQAGELADKIENFAIEKYQAKIQKKVTPEMIAEVRKAQWREASEKMLDGDLRGGIDTYLELLGRYPESLDSISAIEQVVNGYLDLIAQAKNPSDKELLRIELDAVEGYLAERFCGNADRQVMMAAGDAVQRTAAKEDERGEHERAKALKTSFITSYREHPTAATIAAAMANAEQKEGRYADALAFWKVIDEYYTNSTYYTSALYQEAQCLGKMGDAPGQVVAMKRYVESETVPLRKLQSQMALAKMYQDRGYEMMRSVDTIEDPAESNRVLRAASADIVRGIQQYKGFATRADELIADPGVPAADKEEYSKLKDTAMFLVGECWSRLKKPEAKLGDFRQRAAESFEEYVRAYPKGKYAPVAYVKLGMIYTALKDTERAKVALDTLSREFPDSTEAKNAKPSLARSLIEMDMIEDGTRIYVEMLDTDGAYTAGQFVNAGDALITARKWEEADRAFDKAIRVAGTNQMSTVARARIGQANALYRQKRYAEARDSLDRFLEDDRMARMSIAADAWRLLVDVASEQGRTEQDEDLRSKHFGAAVGAVKKLRNYWKDKPLSEQDKVDLMSADVVIRKMRAEEAMGLKDAAAATRARAAAMLQTFRQARGVSATNPVDKLTPGDLENLERCYATMVPLFAAMGPEQADRVVAFGQEYLDLFPNGKDRTVIVNCMNGARAELPSAATKNAAETTAETEGEEVK